MDKHDTATQRSTEGMTDYNRHSSAQHNIILSQQAGLHALGERLGGTAQEIRIVDYGCGPGRSSIAAVLPAIEGYRSKRPDGPVTVCHADQPGNDWNALFGLIFGPSGYQEQFEGIRSEAAVGSFYEPVAPADAVDLATCFAASHWLHRAARLHAPGALWFADLQGEARRAMAKLAQDDWHRFLTLRAKELKSGGFLYLSTLGSVPDATEINGTASSGRGIYRALQVVAQSMADDGLLDSDTLDHFAFSMWFQTAEDAARPLKEDDFLREAFAIERIDAKPAPSNPTDVFGELIGDPTAYAKAYRGYIRAFADSTLRSQLFRPSAPGQDEGRDSEDALANTFYDRLEALYRSRLADYAFEIWHLVVVLQRR